MRIILKALTIITVVIMTVAAAGLFSLSGVAFIVGILSGDWGEAIASLCIMSVSWGCIDMTFREIWE